MEENMQRSVRRESLRANNEEFTRRFYYCSSPDTIKAILNAIFCMIVLFITFKTFRNARTEEELMIGVLLTLVDICMIFVFIGILINKKTGKYQILTIKNKEIIYQQGWIIKKTQIIPMSKIKSCSKRSGLLQRFCDSMDIGITTAGDVEEVFFCNIKNGDEAYNIICQRIV